MSTFLATLHSNPIPIFATNQSRRTQISDELIFWTHSEYCLPLIFPQFENTDEIWLAQKIVNYPMHLHLG